MNRGEYGGRSSRARLMPFASALLFVAGCATPHAPIATPDESLGGIAALRKRIERANSTENLDAITACYAEDATWIPPDGEVLEGRDRIIPRYAESYRQLDLEVELYPDETIASDGWGFERGTTRVRAARRASAAGSPGADSDVDHAVTKRDKYLMIVRKQLNGEWRIWRLMWSPLPATEE